MIALDRNRAALRPVLFAAVILLAAALAPTGTAVHAQEPAGTAADTSMVDDITALIVTVDRLREAGTLLFERWMELYGEQAPETGGGGAQDAEGNPDPHRVDWRQCPQIPRERLASVLGEETAARLPAEDGWGRPLAYCFRRGPAGEARRYLLGVSSPGSDGRYSGPTYRIGAFPPEEPHHDLIWMDGTFVTYPDGA